MIIARLTELVTPPFHPLVSGELDISSLVLAHQRMCLLVTSPLQLTSPPADRYTGSA